MSLRIKKLIALCRRHISEVTREINRWQRVIRELETIGRSTMPREQRVERLELLRDACKFFRDESKEPTRWAEIITQLGHIIRLEKGPRS